MLELGLLRALYVLLYFILTGVLVSTAIGLPGNWILVGAAVVWSLITGFAQPSWVDLVIMAALAGVGEVIEAGLGAVVVARRGGSRWGIGGSILGGFLGVLLGAPVYPPIGSVILGFVGAFAGAVLGELVKQRQMEPALRIGFWSFVGKVMAMAAKMGLGCVILWLIIVRTWN